MRLPARPNALERTRQRLYFRDMCRSFMIFVAAVSLLFTNGDSILAQNAGALKLRFEVLSFSTKECKKITKQVVSLINTGEKEVTVLTERLEQFREKSSDKPGTLEIAFGLVTAVTDKDGRNIIPSLASHAPVTLRKNEVAVLRLDDATSPFGGPFGRLPDQGELIVTYRIGKEWGERLGIWHGAVSSEAFQIENGQVVP